MAHALAGDLMRHNVCVRRTRLIVFFVEAFLDQVDERVELGFEVPLTLSCASDGRGGFGVVRQFVCAGLLGLRVVGFCHGFHHVILVRGQLVYRIVLSKLGLELFSEFGEGLFGIGFVVTDCVSLVFGELRDFGRFLGALYFGECRGRDDAGQSFGARCRGFDVHHTDVFRREWLFVGRRIHGRSSGQLQGVVHFWVETNLDDGNFGSGIVCRTAQSQLAEYLLEGFSRDFIADDA